ncbi:MAG: hypothetical protein ACRESK_07000, partial [Gammaproteobacteria bacterium]
PHVPTVVLYQAELHPDVILIIKGRSPLGIQQVTGFTPGVLPSALRASGALIGLRCSKSLPAIL